MGYTLYMVLDILLGILLLFCLGYGYYRGLMGAIVGFTAKFVSLIVAFVLASPLAGLLDRWFGIFGTFDGILGGAGGRFLTIFICGAVVYILFRIFFHIVGKFIRRAKENNETLNRVDKFLGIFLGIAKFACLMILLSTLAFLLSVIPLVGNSVDWLFEGSTVGRWIFNLVVENVLPTFGDTARAQILDRVTPNF